MSNGNKIFLKGLKWYLQCGTMTIRHKWNGPLCMKRAYKWNFSLMWQQNNRFTILRMYIVQCFNRNMFGLFSSQSFLNHIRITNIHTLPYHLSCTQPTVNIVVCVCVCHRWLWWLLRWRSLHSWKFNLSSIIWWMCYVHAHELRKHYIFGWDVLWIYCVGSQLSNHASFCLIWLLFTVYIYILGSIVHLLRNLSLSPFAHIIVSNKKRKECFFTYTHTPPPTAL